MIDIELIKDNKVEVFKLPSSWDEVTIEMFSKIVNIDPIANEGLYYLFEVIHKLTGIDRDTIENMDYDSFNEVAKHLKFIYDAIPDEMSDSIVIDGEEYFINKDFDKYKVGEIISIELITQDKKYANIYEALPKLLCIFLRKKDQNGDYEVFTTKLFDRVEKFKHIKISEINKIIGFFLTGKNI